MHNEETPTLKHEKYVSLMLLIKKKKKECIFSAALFEILEYAYEIQ